MSYQAPLPNTGAILPVLGSGQAWEGSVYNGNLTGVDNAIGADRARLSTIEGKIANNALVPAGTSAARDGLYGVPSTAAGRVALANSVPRWFNTDAGKGYTQQYFAQEGDAGAGIFTRTMAGWYPAVDSGRIPLSGFTVANTGGAVTRDGGRVILTGACTALGINNIFTNDFETYEMEIEFIASAATNLFWRGRLAGADSSGSYDRTELSGNTGSTATATAETAQTAGKLGRLDTAEGGKIFARFNNPASTTKRTTTLSSGWDSTRNRQEIGSTMNTAQTHDGLTLITAAGSFSGNIRIYGLNPF